MTKLKLIALCLVLASPLAACSDTDGTGSQSVTRNNAPLLESVTADNEELAPGESAVLTAVATDIDQDELSYTWEAPEGWILDGEGAAITVTAPDAYTAEAAVKVTVDDGNGATATGQVTIRTGENLTPKINAAEATPNPVAPAGTTTLSVDASDPNGDTLSVEWAVSGDWTLSSATGTSVDLVAPDRENATTLVGVTVTDGYGGEDSSQFVVSTGSNAVPVISALTATPPQAAPGEEIALKATASDADGDTLTYTWSTPAGWTLDGDGADVSVTAPDAYGQTATVGVVVSDGNGAEAAAEIVISTVSNQGPVISSITANPTNVARGGTIALAASASDPNGDALSYTWSAPTDWTLTPATNGDTASLQAPAQPGQTATVTLTVEDSTGAVAVGSVVVSTLPNNTPTISSLTARPNQVAPGGTIELSSTASDADGDALTYAWAAPTGWSVTGSGADVQLSAPDTYSQSGIVGLTVTDALGASTSSNVIVSTVANSAPSISSLSANPTLVDTGQTSTVTAVASDPNGDALNYTWSASTGWSVTGSGAQATVTAPMDKAASGTISLTVDDGNGLSAQSSVVITTRDNRAPTISNLVANPTTVQPSGTSRLSVTADDLDGDTLTYTWDVPSRWSGSSTTDTIDVTAPNAYSASAFIVVRVSDGTSTVSETVNVTTVANNAPVINSLDAATTTPKVDAMTDITADVTDAEGHQLSYIWTISNPNWRLFGSGASVSLHAPAQPGETVDVNVRVEDSFGGSATSSVQLTSTACATDMANCDVNGANACEVPTANDPDNCGGCGITCGANQTCEAGVCEQALRSELMICGSSTRDVAEFIPANSGLVKVSGCSPTVDTQALMISRTGAGSVTAASLQAYVDGGGNVLTEFNVSDEVFNLIFGTAVAPGTRLGSCKDRVSTVHQYSSSDPYWQNNTFQVVADADTGCGYDVDQYPGITPLAGWSSTDVSLAYRDYGGGRLWLLEADWQDNESTGTDYAYSRGLIQSMIVH